jgi:hypothetical protein
MRHTSTILSLGLAGLVTIGVGCTTPNAPLTERVKDPSIMLYATSRSVNEMDPYGQIDSFLGKAPKFDYAPLGICGIKGPFPEIVDKDSGAKIEYLIGVDQNYTPVAVIIKLKDKNNKQYEIISTLEKEGDQLYATFYAANADGQRVITINDDLFWGHKKPPMTDEEFSKLVNNAYKSIGTPQKITLGTTPPRRKFLRPTQ